MSTESEMVALYIQAEKDVLLGKETQINGRSLTMEDLSDIRAGRKEWESRVNTLAANTGGGRKRFSLVNFN